MLYSLDVFVCTLTVWKMLATNAILIRVYSHFVNSHFVNSHFVNSYLVNFPLCQFHFVNSHLVNVDQMGIDEVGIDKVGRYPDQLRHFLTNQDVNSHRLRLAVSDFGGNGWNDICTLNHFPPVWLHMRKVEAMALCSVEVCVAISLVPTRRGGEEEERLVHTVCTCT